jgi:hypothetical protein
MRHQTVCIPQRSGLTNVAVGRGSDMPAIGAVHRYPGLSSPAGEHLVRERV